MTLYQTGSIVTGGGGNATVKGAVAGNIFTFTVGYTGTLGLYDDCTATILGNQMSATCSAIYPLGVGSFTLFAIRQGRITITLTLDKSTSTPSFPRQASIVAATATIKDAADQPMSGVTVDFAAGAIDLRTNAGHDHQITTAPPGEFRDPLSSSSQLIPSCTTDSNGVCTLLYIVPQASGDYQLRAVLQSDPFTADKKTLTVRTAGLLPLIEGEAFRLTGTESANGKNHLRNHYGTPLLNVIVEKIAADYFSDALVGGHTLGINDMSLPDGGIFDLKGDWHRPHNLHRVGLSVDIDQFVRVGKLGAYRPTNRIFLDWIATVVWGLTKIPEETIHYEALR